MKFLVTSIFLYACKTWILMAELYNRIQTFETRNFQKLTGVAFRDRITHEENRTIYRKRDVNSDIYTYFYIYIYIYIYISTEIESD